MNPEDRARQDIDRQLGQCGWAVQDKGPMNMNMSVALGAERATDFLVLKNRGSPLSPPY